MLGDNHHHSSKSPVADANHCSGRLGDTCNLVSYSGGPGECQFGPGSNQIA